VLNKSTYQFHGLHRKLAGSDHFISDRD
jgi:hypothetical protein